MKPLMFSRDTLRFPQRDFDMVKEGVMSLSIIGVLILGSAALFGAPFRPAVTNKEAALSQPIVVMQTALGDLDGQGTIASYGPPYNNGWHGNAQSTQSIGPLAPETWWGTPYAIHTAQADVLQPLSMLATASGNRNLSAALRTYEKAPYAQQQQWNQNLSNALGKATVHSGQVIIPPGQYGPVALMMQDELSLAKSGLLSGALDRETNAGPYRWNVQNDLLFLQGTVLSDVAGKIDMQGGQWGINHDEQAYPGPWWLTPYTTLYQIPPWSTSPNGDQMAAYTMGLLFALLVLLPFVPGLNKLPRALGVHRLIWRDWYRNLESRNACGTCPLRDSCRQEFKGGEKAAMAAGYIPACYSGKDSQDMPGNTIGALHVG